MNPSTTQTPEQATVAALIARARKAQAIADDYDQAQTDLLCTAAAWAIMEPSHNRALAELAVRDTGLGNVADKIQKNHRKTLGLLRDLAHAKSVGVIAEDRDKGVTEIARPAGIVGAITPSTNPGATPANMIINAMKGRNAVIIAPSPKGHSTAQLLLQYVHAEFDKLNAPRDLVQLLPAPVNKAITHELLQHVDLIVATGSQSNIRAAYSSGKPAFGVGAGNVSAIIHSSANFDDAAEKIVRSKTFDNATSCSSENSLVIEDAAYDAMTQALSVHGCTLLNAAEKSQLQSAMFPDGRLSATFTAKSAIEIASLAGLQHVTNARALMVEENGIGPAFPFSGEKLSPVLTLYRVKDFDDAVKRVADIYAFQGAGHSVGLHVASEHIEPLASRLGHELPVARVIVNQAHAIATGGSFDNGLPFSLSMGCGTWGGNSFSENLTYKNFLNITRIVRPIAAKEADEKTLFAPYFAAVRGS
jgi:sulfoacetaldehyde dehydrogenase